jgi:hypothetical protein
MNKVCSSDLKRTNLERPSKFNNNITESLPFNFSVQRYGFEQEPKSEYQKIAAEVTWKRKWSAEC